MTKPFVIPKSLPACADLLYKLQEEKRVLTHQVREIEEKEKQVREYVINNLEKSNSRGISGRIANVRVTQKTKVNVVDWAAFYEYVRKNKAFEMIQKRLNEAAVFERWDAGKAVPGAEKFTLVGISLTKIKE